MAGGSLCCIQWDSESSNRDDGAGDGFVLRERIALHRRLLAWSKRILRGTKRRDEELGSSGTGEEQALELGPVVEGDSLWLHRSRIHSDMFCIGATRDDIVLREVNRDAVALITGDGVETMVEPAREIEAPEQQEERGSLSEHREQHAQASGSSVKGVLSQLRKPV